MSMRYINRTRVSNLQIKKKAEKSRLRIWEKVKEYIVKNELRDFWTKELAEIFGISSNMLTYVLKTAIKKKLINATRSDLYGRSYWEIRSIK